MSIRSPLAVPLLTVLLAAGCGTAVPALTSRAPVAELRTRAERTDYIETSRYADVIAFLQELSRVEPRLRLTSFGYSHEGRALPLAVWGAAGAEPEAVLATGKTRVLLQANIHAGEVEGKEALQILLRELALGTYPNWADSLVLLVAPIYNADGNERIALSNRPRQHGPMGGMGQRANAQGYDLNRDHMKLDTPEAHALVRLLNLYDPHVSVDLHATNGTYHAYHLTYSPPLHPTTSQAIVGLLREEWLPRATAEMRRKHGWESYYYGNVPRAESPWAAPAGSERGWYTFDHRPRFNNNYVGLRNRVAILSEAYAYLTFRERVEVTHGFVREILHFAHANASWVRRLTEAADSESIVGRQLAVRASFERSPPREILMGEVVEERNPFSGQLVLRRLDVRRPELMPEFGTFVARESERAPAAYLFPPELGEVVGKLAAHGIRMERLGTAREMEIEEFRISASLQAERPFEQHRERTLEGRYEPTRRTLPAGTVVVRVDQPLGRLAFQLLEPRSDDGLTNWNVLDRVLEGAGAYPILRAHAPVP